MGMISYASMWYGSLALKLSGFFVAVLLLVGKIKLNISEHYKNVFGWYCECYLLLFSVFRKEMVFSLLQVKYLFLQITTWGRKKITWYREETDLFGESFAIEDTFWLEIKFCDKRRIKLSCKNSLRSIYTTVYLLKGIFCLFRDYELCFLSNLSLYAQMFQDINT